MTKKKRKTRGKKRKKNQLEKLKEDLKLNLAKKK